MALCIEAKMQSQALDRTLPPLPMDLGYGESVMHDYISRDAITLLGALDMATAEEMSQCNPWQRHQEFLGFLGQIEKSVLEEHDVRLHVNNSRTHKYTQVAEGLPCSGRGCSP
jgi:putative transposase